VEPLVSLTCAPWQDLALCLSFQAQCYCLTLQKVTPQALNQPSLPRFHALRHTTVSDVKQVWTKDKGGSRSVCSPIFRTVS